MDQVYGLDQTLYNGKKYTYILLYSAKGDQYLLSPKYLDGSVTLKGIRYAGIVLNYDIFNQQLLLKYQDKSGSQIVIEVSKSWLERFSLDDKNFIYLDLGQGPRFYQVLGDGPLQILYYWQKNLNLDATVGSSGYIFSSAVRDSYLLMDGKLKAFSTKRSLVRLFVKENWQEIKSYLRKNKVNVKKASDRTMADMINFIGNTR